MSPSNKDKWAESDINNHIKTSDEFFELYFEAFSEKVKAEETLSEIKKTEKLGLKSTFDKQENEIILNKPLTQLQITLQSMIRKKLPEAISNANQLVDFLNKYPLSNYHHPLLIDIIKDHIPRLIKQIEDIDTLISIKELSDLHKTQLKVAKLLLENNAALREVTEACKPLPKKLVFTDMLSIVLKYTINNKPFESNFVEIFTQANLETQQEILYQHFSNEDNKQSPTQLAKNLLLEVTSESIARDISFLADVIKNNMYQSIKNDIIVNIFKQDEGQTPGIITDSSIIFDYINQNRTSISVLSNLFHYIGTQNITTLFIQATQALNPKNDETDALSDTSSIAPFIPKPKRSNSSDSIDSFEEAMRMLEEREQEQEQKQEPDETTQIQEQYILTPNQIKAKHIIEIIEELYPQIAQNAHSTLSATSSRLPDAKMRLFQDSSPPEGGAAAAQAVEDSSCDSGQNPSNTPTK